MSKRKCHFSEELSRKYPCFEQGRNETEAKCNACDCFVSVANGGKKAFSTI